LAGKPIRGRQTQPTNVHDVSNQIRLSARGAAIEAAYSDGPPRRRPRWVRRIVLALAALALLSILSLGLLALADFAMAGNGSRDVGARAQWTWERGDHLHYAVHLVAGRVLDLCPCTRRAAAAQYHYAHFHAVTPRQVAVINNVHPATPGAWAAYIAGPFAVGLDWVGDGVHWLAGNRPALALIVDVSDFEFQQHEIHIARGTTVTWRNVDELGEAHTVTADVGQLVKFDSDWLEPDETFAFTFTERGRFIYYCQAHGGPQLKGMSGVVIVE
jgi:plastocyanin